MSQRSQRGFTLIELMVVVAIVGVVSGILFGVSSRPDGANAQTTAEQLQSTFTFVRTRAVASRRVHRVTIFNVSGTTEQAVLIEAAPTTGMVADTTIDWPDVETRRVPFGAKIRSVTVGSTANATNANPAQDTGMPAYLYFKPDGSATAATVYVTDFNGTPHFYRVLVYKATGSSYARQTW